MTPLPLRFSRSTFTYRQVCRFGDVAIYRKHPIWGEKPPTLEVVRFVTRMETATAPGIPPKKLSAFEAYPQAKEYGRTLFSAADEAEAFGIMAALLWA